MDLLLWRHAQAEAGFPDLQRRLTAKGQQQAIAIAGWLRPRLAADCTILVSPALRTMQTAAALQRDVQISTELAPGNSVEQLLKIAGWPQRRGTVLIVGHQPTLGEVAATLLAGEAQSWRIRKGNLWWIAQHEIDGETINFLKSAIGPDCLT